MTTLFVSPHFDDVVFSCVAHLEAARLRGRTWVATAFAAHQPLRCAEDARALALLGCEQVVLPFADAPTRLGLSPGFRSLLSIRHGQEEQDRRALAEVLAAWVAERGISHVVLPLGVGGHVDHRIVHGLHDAFPAGVEVSFFEDQPYARIHGALASRLHDLAALTFDEQGRPTTWPSPPLREVRESAYQVFAGLMKEDAARAEVDELIAAWSHRSSSSPGLRPRLRLESRLLPARPQLAEAALRCYASELPAWFPTDLHVHRFLAGAPHERSWRKVARTD